MKSPQCSAAVAQFLSRSAFGMYIDGRWTDASENVADVVDPGTGRAIAQISLGGAQDVDAAVQAARRSFQTSGWASMDVSERAALLGRLADLVESHAATISEIESMDVGKPLPQAQWDIQNFSDTARYYADLSTRVRYREPIDVAGYEARSVHQPYGVCAFIFPWNFPFLLVGWGIFPALAAGNTVVIKPAEDTPLSTLYVMDLVRQAGIPDGVVNVVTGYGETTGAALASHAGISRMSFTGSPEVGRLVARSCGYNLIPVKLELGGKGAAVVFEDVDIPATAKALAQAITLNTGQVCCTASRWLVHESIYDLFVDAAIREMSSVRIGYGRDPETQMGPVVSSKQRARVLGYLDKAQEQGARMLLAGGLATVPGHEDGYYIQPAIIEGAPDNVACRDEIFGPVPYLMRFQNEAEAIETVNRSPYGLANSVWTSNLDRANRVAERLAAGNSWVNAHNVFAHGVPYGGINLSGMGGGVLSPSTLFDYMRPLSVVRPR